MRAMHYKGKAEFYFFVNEAAEPWQGQISLPETGPCYWYDPWANEIYPAPAQGGALTLALPPRHSRMLILDTADPVLLRQPALPGGEALPLENGPRRRLRLHRLPAFGPAKTGRACPMTWPASSPPSPALCGTKRGSRCPAPAGWYWRSPTPPRGWRCSSTGRAPASRSCRPTAAT